MLREALYNHGLTTREMEVATLISRGLTNKAAGARLFVTEKTIKFHLTGIYRKIGVKSKAEFIVWCIPNTDFLEKKEIEKEQLKALELEPLMLPPGLRPWHG